MALQERRGYPEEALGTCYQPFGNQGAGARFREILFHLNGEYHRLLFVTVGERLICDPHTL
jgi:hypothetical protein